MTLPLRLYVAGCARDCSRTIAANISMLLSLGNHPSVELIRIFVAENDSRDCTRQILVQLANDDDRVIPLFFDNLDFRFPRREARIAFCRDRLLSNILSLANVGLYIPIDLDLDLCTSLSISSFLKACSHVSNGNASGIFPSSSPYYYDIYALRHSGWCPTSCWQEIQDATIKGAFARLVLYMIYVSSRQKPHLHLCSYQDIAVESAFGGMGVYSLSRVFSSGARYYSSELGEEGVKICEHVIFNRYFDSLYIYPDWVIAAPRCHIDFRMLSFHVKVFRLCRAACCDVNRVLRAVFDFGWLRAG